MHALSLMPHPDMPPKSVRSVEVEMSGTGANVALRFYIAPCGALAVPAPVAPGRADGLWQRTCCEMFLKPEGGEGYVEFNLSPSGEWAAYSFDGYRAAMRELEVPANPRIELERQGEALVLEAEVDVTAIAAGPLALGLSAVIEEKDGTKSYWALRHPPGAPDFHHPDCFALQLPAPDAT